MKNKIKNILIVIILWPLVWIILYKCGFHINWDWNLGAMVGYCLHIMMNPYTKK